MEMHTNTPVPLCGTQPLIRDWIIHHGVNAPVPSGTKIEAELFSGDLLIFTTGAVMFDDDGNAEPQTGPTRYNAWKFHDGGPMDPKIRAYRLLGCEMERESYADIMRVEQPAHELVGAH